MKKLNFLLFSVVIGSVSYASQQRMPLRDSSRLQGKNVQEVANRLLGDKDSAIHAGNDRRFSDLRISFCKINVSHIPGYISQNSEFLYFEQAQSIALDRPLRQGVVRLSPSPIIEKNVIAALYQPSASLLDLKGSCRGPQADRVISYTTLNNSFCVLDLHRTQNLWHGKTQGSSCEFRENGSTKAIFEWTLFPGGEAHLWERGFDSSAELIWGTPSGPNQFKPIDISKTDTQVNAIAQRLSGRSNSYRQASADPENFLPLSFNNCPITINGSEFGNDARVVLIDQVADTPTIKFNRVRFLVVTRSEDKKYVTTANYALKEPKKYHGLCNLPLNQRVGAQADVDRLECRMYFQQEGSDFVGGTPDNGCPSNYQGATRLIVEARLQARSFFDWERWLDEAGKVVAGSLKGPYFFELE
jgi:hypothetical protein